MKNIKGIFDYILELVAVVGTGLVVVAWCITFACITFALPIWSFKWLTSLF